jgi:hypothetical protein
MKKILLVIFAFLAAGALMPSCDDVETGFAKLTSEPDPGASYYVQFINASNSYETGVSESGALVEVEQPVSVVLMGIPQSAPISVNLTVDPSSTMTPSMYTLSANSITIDAGKTSGSVTFKTNAANMPVGQTLKLVLTISAGDHNSPNPTATKLTYSVKRIEFCPLVNGVATLAGTYAGSDAGYTVSNIIATVSTTKLMVENLSEEMMADFWGETIIAGGSFLMTVTGNGLIDIPRQYIYTTIYKGATSEYEIKGSGKWENCGAKPKLTITYDIYYVGDTDGIAKTYGPAYLGGITIFTATLTKSSKSDEILDTNASIRFKPIDPSLKPKR